MFDASQSTIRQKTKLQSLGLAITMFLIFVLVGEMWLSIGTLYLDIGCFRTLDVSKTFCIHTQKATFWNMSFHVCKQCSGHCSLYTKNVEA